MPRANEYRHIAAWGRLMQSHRYYVLEEQAKAALDNAPIDAIFRRFRITEPPRVWATFADIKDPNTRTVIERFLAEQPHTSTGE